MKQRPTKERWEILKQAFMKTEATNKPSAEELLKPRIKVIADWPGSHFEADEILDVERYGARLISQKTGKSVNGLKYDRYPHLFKKLDWWELRQPSEMPDYVKREGEVRKVAGWSGCNSVVEFGDNIEGATSFWLPATESEYVGEEK